MFTPTLLGLLPPVRPPITPVVLRMLAGAKVLPSRGF